jgi:hypothetical protein
VRKSVALFMSSILAIAGYVVISQSSAPGALVAFNGFSTGTNVHADVLRTAAGGPTIADAEVAFSGAAVNSSTVPAGGVHNEENIAVVPTPGAPDAAVDSTGMESFGKGDGLEIGLGTNLPNDDLNQLVLTGRAEAAAQPATRSDGDPPISVNDTGPVVENIEIAQAAPLLYLQALHGDAQARFNENFCIKDGFMSDGLGRVAKAELVDADANANTVDLDSPLIATSTDFFGESRGVAQTHSFTSLFPLHPADPNTHYGLQTETHMTFAPISLLQTDATLPAPIVVEILGEWIFRATATGEDGGANVSYEVAFPSDPANPDPTVVRIYLAPADANATPAIEITRSQLFTDTGINVPIPGGAGPQLLNLTLGEDARAISPAGALPDPASDPTEAADGTEASGAADIIRLDLLNAGPLDPGPRVANVRVGHFEAQAEVPDGGITCPVPPPPTTTTTAAGATTTTAAGATTTTAPGATTTTTEPGATTTTTEPGATTTTTAAGATTTTPPATTTTIPTVVGGVNITRSATPPAEPVTAQPRFTG